MMLQASELLPESRHTLDLIERRAELWWSSGGASGSNAALSAAVKKLHKIINTLFDVSPASDVQD